MCGIVGVAGNLTAKEEKAFNTMLILDAIRGIDSTGAAFIHSHVDPTITKQVGNPYELMGMGVYTKAMNKANKAIIGHNRWATVGDVSRRTAHPFEFDSLIGVHNGTLKTKWKLADAADFKVDSENFFHHVDKLGLKDAMKNMDGAWSLVWWDKYEDKLCFLRNKERPMHIVFSEDKSKMFWASERWMVAVAADREGIKLGEFHTTGEDLLYEFEIDATGKIGKPVVTPMPSTYVPPYPQNQQNYNRGPVTTYWDSKSQTQVTKPIVTTNETKTPSNVVTLPAEKKSTASRKFYVNSKNIELDLESLDTDVNGANYIHCFDSAEPYIAIRLYYKKGEDIREKIGQSIIADIKDIKITKDEGTYYKVGRYTIKQVPADIAAVTKSVVDDLRDDIPFEFGDPKVNDHRGRPITVEEFQSTYGSCACCTGYTDPMKGFKYTMAGDAICHECASDKEIVSMCNLM